MSIQRIKPNNLSNILLIIIVIVIGLIAIGYVGFQLVDLKKANNENLNNQSTGQAVKNINSTASWQSYVDSHFYYSFKYPSDWYKEDENPYDPSANPVNQEKNSYTVQFCPNSNKLSVNAAYPGPCLDIRSYTLDSSLSLKEIANYDEDFVASNNTSFIELVKKSMKDITIDGKSAIFYTIDSRQNPKATEPAYIKEVLIRNGNTIHDIEFVVESSNEFQNWENIYNLILSTLKFVK